MGQVGLHALTGLVVGQQLLMAYAPERPARRALMYGFVLGNIAPDLDFIAVVGLFPVDQHLALHMHRSFTHSLVAAAAAAFGLGVIALIMRQAYLRYMGWGFSLGMVAHFTEDIFLWFVPVDIFWPASLFGLIPPVDFWFWWDPPPALSHLMTTGEFAALALYYHYLIRIAERLQTNLDMIPPVRRMAMACWVAWAVTSALIFDISAEALMLLVYIPIGLIFVPACFYITWRMQETIELHGARGPE